MNERDLLISPPPYGMTLCRLIGAFREGGMGALSFHRWVPLLCVPVWVVLSRPAGPRRWCPKRGELRRSLRSRLSQPPALSRP